MNSSLLYQWQEVIDKVFPQMGRWQKRTLALFICGVVVAQSCILTQVSRHLSR